MLRANEGAASVSECRCVCARMRACVRACTCMSVHVCACVVAGVLPRVSQGLFFWMQMSYLRMEKGEVIRLFEIERKLGHQTNEVQVVNVIVTHACTRTHAHPLRTPFENNAAQPQDCQDCSSEIWHVRVDNLQQKVFSIILSIPSPVHFLLTLPSSFCFLIFEC